MVKRSKVLAQSVGKIVCCFISFSKGQCNGNVGAFKKLSLFMDKGIHHVKKSRGAAWEGST